MPRSKNKPKSEKADIIPLDEEDIKRATEVKFKHIEERDLIRIEKPGKILKKKTRKTKPRVSKLKTRSFMEDSSKIDSKLEDYILIITEKPAAAEKIANALGKPRRLSAGGVAYYSLERDNKNIVVACAVGHLFSLATKQKGWPIFDIFWQPSFEKNAWTKKYYSLLEKLVKKASSFIVASVDYNELTPVLENGEFKILKIGGVIDSIIEGKRREKDFKVPAFNFNGKIEFRDLKKAIRHPINESLYELSLEYGRKVKLTSSHNVFILEDNKIENVKTANLKIGDKILCPAFLPSPQDYKKEINLLELVKHEKKRELYISGEDVAQILKRKVINLKRKNMPLNDERVILTLEGKSKIKISRNNLGCSTSVMGKRAGVCQSSIVQWENGIKNPSLANFKKYLMALNLNPKEFTEDKEYCIIAESSFSHLLSDIYQNQFKNFSNFSRATIPLYSLSEEDIKDLRRGFIYGSKNKRNKLPIKIPITKELVRLMGYYLAEGDINNDYRIRFSLGLQGYGHEQMIIDEIKEFCSLYGIDCHHYLHKKIKHQIITIDNSVLALLFKKIFAFGDGARNKRIPSLIFNLPVDLKKEFLKAYFLGDGSINKSGISFSTSSENLALDISYLLLQLRIISSTYQAKNSGKGNLPSWHVSVTNSSDLCEVREIWENHHLSRKLKISKIKYKKRNLSFFEDLNLIAIKNIKKVQPSNKYVYDFSVEGENFIAGNGGVCCHNTDYDVEGEVIGWNIIRFIAKQKDASRMKFSTLTSHELEQAYEEIASTINWGQAIAGETRHKLDWMYGINLSRALMETIKKAGRFRILSIGRVQGPALHLIVEKELEIEKFKSTPYWQIFIKLEGHELELKYEKDITDKKELGKFDKLEGKKGLAITNKTERSVPPQTPFDLTSLQREAYRLFGINPAKTLQIAQNLYLQGIISYPRTSSQKIPEAINPKAILKKLNPSWTKFVSRDKPVEGNKSDPAHPSIYPTGEYSRVKGEDEKIYNLIVKRFISCFCSDAIIKDKRIIFEMELGKFKASGLEIKDKGWMNVYPLLFKENEIEDIEGEKIISSSRIEEKETQPPRRYTPASIITELEKRNLGTKATRANIIETLYNRNYVKGQSIQATPLGISLIKSLKKYSPIIIDEKLTREFEKDMTEIERAKKGLEEKEGQIIKKAEVSITKISEDFKKHQDKIGKELVSATEENYKIEREESTLNECPVCKTGKLRILFNKRFQRSFVACNAYPNCKTTFSLPPGLIKRTDKVCEACSWPMLMAIRKGKRPWVFCFNPGCKTRLEYQKNKEKAGES